MNELLKRQISLLPDHPGVYLMKDSSDKIIYIGKAKNLKKRVSQYFLRPQAGKVFAMVSHVDHFDTILVHSDKEAFILEMNLIQTHYPRYNIMLTDDSHYPYIAVSRSDGYLKIARHATDKRFFYYGPYPDSGDAYKTIDLLNALFPTRKCRTLPKKACLYYHMGQCLAPCVNPILPATYAKLYADIKSFLSGNVEEAKILLKKKMLDASEKENYEDAAYYKGMLEAIERIVAKQSVELSSDKTDRDVFAYAEREGYLAIVVMTYRGGLLLGKRVDVVEEFGEPDEQVAELIEGYYQTHELPNEISCNVHGFGEEFASVYPEARVIVPKEGRLLSQIDLASLNAQQGLDAHFMSARLNDDNLTLLEELGKLLGIDTPYRIELFDNSHLQGSSPVGAMVCYINGEPCKKMYRKFHLDEKDAGDDYHSMKEIVGRRYARLKEENGSYPDLILVDGGLTQVRAAKEGLAAAEAKIPEYGLYKNSRHQTEGVIDEKENTYPLDSHSPLFFLLMRMQDEVHRFAIVFHRRERSKAMRLDVFDEVKGLGAKRKELLRKHYPTVDSLKGASLQELRQLLPDEVASALYSKVQAL
jgi:excinuclease ABC subunit C